MAMLLPLITLHWYHHVHWLTPVWKCSKKRVSKFINLTRKERRAVAESAPTLYTALPFKSQPLGHANMHLQTHRLTYRHAASSHMTMLTKLMFSTTIYKLTLVHMHPADTPTGALFLSNERKYIYLPADYKSIIAIEKSTTSYCHGIQWNPS